MAIAGSLGLYIEFNKESIFCVGVWEKEIEVVKTKVIKNKFFISKVMLDEQWLNLNYYADLKFIVNLIQHIYCSFLFRQKRTKKGDPETMYSPFPEVARLSFRTTVMKYICSLIGLLSAWNN